MQKYLAILYVSLCALLLHCAGAKPVPCTAAQLSEIVAECKALELVTCKADAGGGGATGAAGAPDDVCGEVKAQCAARVNAWEVCK